jgi:subtilisin family serine protease
MSVLTVAVIAASTAPAVAAPGPSEAPEYWFDQWNVPSLWSQGARGNGVTIAEIDTGVNASLPELSANVLGGKDFGAGGDGRIDRDSDEFGHGTAMASIMVAHRGELDVSGIAPDAKVLPIAVPLIGTTDARDNDNLAEAIRWGADHGGKVISMSLGGRRPRTAGVDPCPSDEQDAIYHALSKGAIVVAAAGNDGPVTNTVEEPAVCLGVVSVGALDSGGNVASFSSRHPYLTMSAPGVNVPSLSRVPGEGFAGDGTSQATAIASAVFALVWSKYPTLTNRQVVARVLATLDDKRTTRDPAYGYGRLDAGRAVTAALGTDLLNPVFDATAPFVARTAAFDRADHQTLPRPAGDPQVSVGNFAIGNAPRLLVPKVIGGLSVAGAGLVLLVALLIVARVRRRNRPAPVASWEPAVPFGAPGSAGSPWGENLVGVVQFDRPGDAVGNGTPQRIGEQEHHRHDEADVEDAVHDSADELAHEHLPPGRGPLVADVVDPHAGELFARRLPAGPDDERPDHVSDDQRDDREDDLQ